jgi:hypothetical protein
MRLGQLARKLSVTPSAIVDLLSAKNVVIEKDVNARVETDHALVAIRHFKPDLVEIEVKHVAEEIDQSPERDEKTEETENIFVSEISTSVQITEQSENKEIIKAPKAELPGLKVLGKIDLPEPKKKEEPKSEIEAAAEQPNPKANRNRKLGKQTSKQPNETWVNPLALQREREARAEEERRREQAEKKKQQRTASYHKRVQHKQQPARPARIINEAVEEVVTEKREAPRTWLGKIWSWLSNP